MTGFFVELHSSNNTLFLPQELSEKILYYLKVDRGSLTSSSLVCRSWAYVSRSTLFRTLTFRPEIAQRFHAILASIGIRTSAFFTPPVSTHCKTLHIRSISPSYCPCFEAGPASFLQHPIRPFFSTITKLVFSQCNLPQLPGFILFVSAFVNLESLSLDEVHWDKSPSRQTIGPSTTLSSITTLVTRNLDWQHFYGCVNRNQLLPSVSQIRLGPADESDAAIFMTYIFRISPDLHRLSIAFTSKCERSYISGMAPALHNAPAIDLQTVVSAINTSQARVHLASISQIRDEYQRIWGLGTSVYNLPKLTEMRLEEFFNVYRGPMQPTALFWAPRLFTSMVAPRLRRIELELILERTGQLDQYEINWNFLDYVLSSGHYSALERVVFNAGGPVDLGSLQNLLSMRMPLISRCGLLEVCLMDDDCE